MNMKLLRRLSCACLLTAAVGSESPASSPRPQATPPAIPTTPTMPTVGADALLMTEAGLVVDAIGGYFGFTLTDQEKSIAVSFVYEILLLLQQYQLSNPTTTPASP